MNDEESCGRQYTSDDFPDLKEYTTFIVRLMDIKDDIRHLMFTSAYRDNLNWRKAYEEKYLNLKKKYLKLEWRVKQLEKELHKNE